jgi:hypothetical protein
MSIIIFTSLRKTVMNIPKMLVDLHKWGITNNI